MVQIETARTEPAMDEMPKDEVRAEDKVMSQLTLKAYVHMLRRPAWSVGGEDYIGSAGGLLGDLNGAERRISVGEGVGEPGSDGRKNGHQIGCQ